MIEEGIKSTTAFNIFKTTVKGPNHVAIEIFWKSSWSLSPYQKRQQAKQKENGKKESFKTEGRNVGKLERASDQKLTVSFTPCGINPREIKSYKLQYRLYLNIL